MSECKDHLGQEIVKLPVDVYVCVTSSEVTAVNGEYTTGFANKADIPERFPRTT